MSDLVKRLREANDTNAPLSTFEHWELERGAAAAIERKDAAIAELQVGLAYISNYANNLAEEKPIAIDELVDALKGVVRVADRETDEFIIAKNLIEQYDKPKDGL